MEATIASFRGSRRTRSNNQMVIQVTGFKNKEDAEWKSYLDAHKPNGTTIGDAVVLEGE